MMVIDHHDGDGDDGDGDDPAKLVHIWRFEYFLWQAPMIFDEYLQKTICKCRKLDSGAFGRPIAQKGEFKRETPLP